MDHVSDSPASSGDSHAPVGSTPGQGFPFQPNGTAGSGAPSSVEAEVPTLTQLQFAFRERFEALLPTIQREWPEVARHTLEATRGSFDNAVEVISRQTGLTSQGVKQQLQELLHTTGEQAHQVADTHARFYGDLPPDSVLLLSLDPQRLEEALGPDTLLVSVMAANNEIGVLQPLERIGAICRRHGVLFHCDAAQAVGHIPLAMAATGIDLLSLSGHKLYGPPGIGALVVAEGVAVAAQQHGGGQEQGLRAGSLPVPLIVGLASALELALADREARAGRLAGLRDRLWRELAALGGVRRNGHASQRLPHNLNITVAGVDGIQLHQRLRRQIAVSSGSACSQGSPSHVLAALGRSRSEAAAAIRFGLGRATTAAEIETAINAVADAVAELRRQP
jgi:hypothetical protein